MCGIAGFVHYQGDYSSRQLHQWALEMRDALVHRGPDDAGLWTSPDGRVWLTQRRLSIIDLRPEGRQPMSNEDDSVVVTFNGEIYNYQQLTRELSAAGHRFASRTDTEVLCHLFEEDPVEAVDRIEGQYAFAAWRERAQELVLARDRFGKKPLYYAMGRGLLAFASELRSLEVIPGLCADVDAVAVQQYLLLQYVHAPRTIYRRVHKQEPGTLLRFRFGDRGAVAEQTIRFFSFMADEPADADGHKPPDPAAAVEKLRTRIIDAVRVRLVADVPVGAFLSSGVDSSLVVAVMARELGVKTRTFSIGFKDSPESEHLVARQVARALGTEHHELVLDPSAVDLLPVIAQALDEPNGDSSCLPMYLLSEFARRHVTVTLSGDGGDEMFGGYRRYGEALVEASDPLRHLRALRRTRRIWSLGRAYLSGRWLHTAEDTLTLLSGPILPENRELLVRWRNLLNDRSRPLIHRLRMLDVEAYMPGAVLAKVDRMSMRFALEVRCPLLDVRLARWAAQAPADWCHDGKTSKKLLKALLARYLPREIVDRPKLGFGLPERCWSKEKLLGLAHDLLLSKDSGLADFLDPVGVGKYLHIQQRPEAFSVFQIWSLLVLEQWLRGAARARSSRLAA